MRHIGRIEFASVAAPWPSTALPAVLLWTSLSVGVRRPALQLLRASQRPGGPSAVKSGSAAADADLRGDPRQTDRPARRHGLKLPRLRLRPRCQPPWDRFESSWAIWDSPPPMPLVCGGAVDSAVSSVRERVQTCEAGKRKEGPLGMLMLRHPSRWLARAMAGRSPCQTREIVVRWLLILFSSPQDDAQRPHVEECG